MNPPYRSPPETLAAKFTRHAKKHLMSIVAAVGIGGLATGAVMGARAWAAVLMVEKHERELHEVKLNSYLTCIMVKQLYNERIDTVKLQLAIDLDCKQPGDTE